MHLVSIERKIKKVFFAVLAKIIKIPKYSVEDIKNSNISKILVMRHDWIGDMVMTTPFFRELRKAYPEAHIALVCSNFNKGPIIHNPHINEIIVLDPGQKKRRRLNPMKLDIKKLVEIRNRKFDMSICFTSGSTSSTMISLLCGAKFKIGVENVWGREYLNMFYNLLVPVKVFELHEVKRNISFLQFIGIEPKDYSLEIFTNLREDKAAQVFLEKHGIEPNDVVIGIHNGAHKKGFAWPTDRFAFIADKLISEYKAKVVLICSPGDESFIQKLIEMMTHKPIAIYYGTIATEFSALFRRFPLFICNDSGIMHVAAASGCKVIALFGPSSVVQYGPSGNSCFTIAGKDGNVENITTEEVLSKVDSILIRFDSIFYC